MMSSVSKRHRMAALAGHTLQRTLLARWRHAAIAPIYSAAGRQCQVDVSSVVSDGAGSGVLTLTTQKTYEDAPSAVLAATPIASKKAKRKLVVPQHGINDKLPKSTWSVIRPLKELGFDTYVVGGSVRDLLLKQVPKDYDVLSTASLSQVKKGLRLRTKIIGKRFPICIVTFGQTVVEVSSFGTTLRTFGHERPQKLVKACDLLGVDDWDENDFARWENSQKRDFTVNGLLYDPFKKVLYDYVGGLEDLKKSKIRTVTRATDSFAEDPARILRAFRFAARLQFSLARSTAKAVESQKHLIRDIDESRLALEANMLMAYGAAERSMRLLSKHGALEYIFPLQAKYLSEHESNGDQSNLLLDLLGNMDRVFAPDKPCHTSLWVLIQAFHLGVTKRKRSHLSAATFALAVYHRTGIKVAEKKARRVAKRHKERANFFFRESVLKELSVDEDTGNSVTEEVEDLVTDVTKALKRSANVKWAQTGKGKAMQMVERAKETLPAGDPACPVKKRGDSRDDPERVKAAIAGDLDEVSYIFSRIVLNTLFPSSDSI